MEYQTVGRSGLRISSICLGTMSFGKTTDPREAASIVDAARDAGVNLIDTAASYAGGLGEEIVGELLAPERDRWVIATKVGTRTGPGPNEDGIGRHHMRAAIDRSLRRLRSDRVDLYYLHRDDGVTPLAEAVGAMGELIRAGKVLYWGLSNFRAWRVADAVALARELGVPPPIVVQPYYHALNRRPEVELLPAAAHHELGVIPYSPLARGILSGKYAPGEAAPEDSRAGRGDHEILDREWREGSLQIAARLAEHAKARGMTPGQFAVNWLLSNRLVTAILAGPRTLGQWREYLGALDHPFDAEDAALVDRLVPAGSASTHGYHDPAYPLTGRVHRDLVAGR